MIARNALILSMLVCVVMASCTKDEELLGEAPGIYNSNVHPRASATHCSTDVYDATTLDVTGAATLIRNDNKISMTFHAENLTPGNAYTVWWVIWNKPENCAIPFACDLDDLLITQLVEVDVPFAAGLVVGTDGVGSFAASRMEGDTTGSTNHLFNAPPFALEDARTAEIHLLLRDHGPAIPGQVQEQISTFLGGCDVYACYEPMFAIFSPDCGL
jgi:hypothetical protein